jgi:hypothetical protein
MAAEKDPVSPELRRLLEMEAARVDPPASLKAEVRARLATEFRGRKAPRGRPRPVRAGLSSAKLWAVVGGVAVGAGLLWRVSRPGSPAPAPTVQALSQPPSPAVAPEPAQLVPRPAEPQPVVPPLPRKHSGGMRHVQSLETSLARERQLIEEARAELRAGRPTDALSALGKHEREFPKGILLEERLGLQIEVLAARGELAAARRRAQDFRVRFPKSPLQSAIDSALRREAP